MIKSRGYLIAFALIISMTSFQSLATSTKSESGDTPQNYWAPKNPPKAHYKIECSIDLSKGSINGIETISFNNSASKPIYRLKIKWISLGNMQIRSNGKALNVLSETKAGANLSVLVELNKPLYQNEKIELDISFAATVAGYAGIEEVKLTSWYPRLDWVG